MKGMKDPTIETKIYGMNEDYNPFLLNPFHCSEKFSTKTDKRPITIVARKKKIFNRKYTSEL